MSASPGSSVLQRCQCPRRHVRGQPRAVHDTATPLVMSVANIAINLAVEIPLLWWLGEAAMAVGTLASFSVQAVIMLWLLQRRTGQIGLTRLIKPLAKIL